MSFELAFKLSSYLVVLDGLFALWLTRLFDPGSFTLILSRNRDKPSSPLSFQPGFEFFEGDGGLFATLLDHSPKGGIGLETGFDRVADPFQT